MKASTLLHQMARALEDQAAKFIRDYMDSIPAQVTIFEDTDTEMCFYPASFMYALRKVEDRYYLLSEIRESGKGSDTVRHEIDDHSCIPLEDLIFIVEQIELKPAPVGKETISSR
jgi:hypothetical protein